MNGRMLLINSFLLRTIKQSTSRKEAIRRDWEKQRKIKSSGRVQSSEKGIHRRRRRNVAAEEDATKLLADGSLEMEIMLGLRNKAFLA